MKRKILLLPLLLLAVVASAEPIVRVVRADGTDKAFAAEQVRKLVLSADAVDVVSNAGTVLLNVPKADIARVEFAEDVLNTSSTSEATLEQDSKSVKIIEHGSVYILHNGKKYTIMGVQIESAI